MRDLFASLVATVRLSAHALIAAEDIRAQRQPPVDHATAKADLEDLRRYSPTRYAPIPKEAIAAALGTPAQRSIESHVSVVALTTAKGNIR